VAAVALLAVGAAHFTVRARAEGGVTWPGLPRVTLVIAMLVAYVATLTTLGFLLTTVVMLLVLIRGVGSYSWPASIGLAVALGGACHVVFRLWLGMPLPDGPLPF